VATEYFMALYTEKDLPELLKLLCQFLGINDPQIEEWQHGLRDNNGVPPRAFVVTNGPIYAPDARQAIELDRSSDQEDFGIEINTMVAFTLDRSKMAYKRKGKNVSVHEIIIQAVSDWMRQEPGDVVLKLDFTLVLVRRKGHLLVNADWDYWEVSSLLPLPLPFTMTDRSGIMLEQAGTKQ
jgi:hypothetical protein